MSASTMKIYQDCDIHPSSTMHSLMETHEKTRKPDDQKKVVSHYADIERVFKQQCGLSDSPLKTRWAVGTRAYQEGWDAYEAEVGVPGTVLTNPYPEGTHERDSSDHREHMDWEMGWGDAWDYWNDDPA